MNDEIVKDALFSALALLNNEVECIEVAELSNDYLKVIEKIEIALKELR